MDKWFKSSLCSPKKHAVTRAEKGNHIYSTALYVMGYFISIATLMIGSGIHYLHSNDQDTLHDSFNDKEDLNHKHQKGALYQMTKLFVKNSVQPNEAQGNRTREYICRAGEYNKIQDLEYWRDT